MQAPSFTIGGIPTPFEAAWVKLKARPHEPTDYEICVPQSLWSAVFELGTERAESQSWSEYLCLEAEEYGFPVDLWLRALSEYCPSPHVRHWDWVIATVDRISEHKDHIRVVGQAERFEPWRYPPVALLPLE